jgi:hypothetical protein
VLVACKKGIFAYFLFGGVWFGFGERVFRISHAIALLHCAVHCFLSLFIGITLFWVAH